MIRNDRGQAKCQGCHGWHWAIQLDDNLNPTEFKCTRCGRIIKFKPKIKIDTPMTMEVKDKGKLGK